MAENEASVNHEDVSILIDRPPPMPVADHFLDGAEGMRDNCFAVKSVSRECSLSLPIATELVYYHKPRYSSSLSASND